MTNPPPVPSKPPLGFLGDRLYEGNIIVYTVGSTYSNLTLARIEEIIDYPSNRGGIIYKLKVKPVDKYHKVMMERVSYKTAQVKPVRSRYITLGSNDAAQVSTIFDLADAGINIQPGGQLTLSTGAAAGYVVTATTADILTITNTDGSNTATYDIILIGD